jgi:hypothetical protein
MARWRWAGWSLVLLLAFTGPASAQERPPPLVELRENYPNPFFPSTTIPFVLNPDLCERGHQPLVSLKIYNVLAQVVGVPILVSADNVRLEDVRLPCGSHEAFWDGRTPAGKRKASPGLYYAQLTVDGERFTRQMIIRK